MKNVKRSLSALLAVVMVFTMMAVAFTVTGSAAPTVARIPATRLSPTVALDVPEVIETWGTSYYESGSNVKPGGEVQATITSHIAGAEVKDISLQCSDAGIQISDRQLIGDGGSVWTIQGGVLKTPPADDGATVVKWTVKCTIAGKTYVTYAWSQVQPHYNNPGFAVRVTHKNSLSAHRTYNHHVEWIQPVFGTPATDVADNFSQCFVNEGDGQQYAATGVHAASYYWNWNQGSGDDETHTAALTAKGWLYVDVSQKTNLTAVGLAARAKPHNELEDPSNHPQSWRGASITYQSVNGNTSTVFSVNSPGGQEVGVGSEIGATFSGQLPAAGGTAKINAQIEWRGQITAIKVGIQLTQRSYHDTKCNYQINIVTYDKTALKAALDNASAANYQAEQFRNTAPAGINSYNFKSWNEYLAALQQAWYIYGRVDVTKAQIDEAKNALIAAMPIYDANTGAWTSGMMYADADYSQINTIRNTISDTLDPDFFEDYSDGTHGKYYQYTLATALNEALEDIDYEMKTQNMLLDARYQNTVDQMRTNLTNAVNALEETSTKKTTKLVTLEFKPNMSGVTNMPDNITTSLTGQFNNPDPSSINPPRVKNYNFVGWFFDPEMTQPVTWPLYIDPENEHFKADLEDKVDNAGVAYTVYAGWSVKATSRMLTFDTMGGSPIDPYVGENGEQYGGPSEVPTKTGCRFLGWYTDDTFQTPVNWDTFTMGSLSTVYARWAENSFTVTFNANGGLFADGSPSFSVTDLYGTPIDIPVPPKKDSGNTGFDGWYYDSNLTNPVDMSTFSIPDDNIQVFAKWNTTKRNLIIDPQNGEQLIVRTYDVSYRITDNDMPALVNEGYTQKGWYLNPTGKGSQKKPPYSMTTSYTVYAVWTGLPVTLIFDPNGGEMSEDFDPTEYEDKEGGSALTLPENPTMDEHVFTGWTLNGEPFTGDVYPISSKTENDGIPEEITLVASWAEEPYVATFRLRTDVENDTVEQGDVITATVSMMANRYVANHRFIVYYDTRYLQPALNGQPVTSNITGTAACSKSVGRAYFTLTRYTGMHNLADCGTPIGRITPGNIMPLATWFPEEWILNTTTLKEEYKYYEFVYFDAPNVPSGTRTRPTEEMDICSFQFIVKSDAPVSDELPDTAQLLMPTEFVRTPEQTTGNRIGACLQADATYTNAVPWENTTNVVVDGDQRFAVSQMHACRIEFVTNGGNAVAAIENAKQGGTITLPNATRDYYNFVGWAESNDPDAPTVSSPYTVPNADIVWLYAKWTGKSVKYYVRHHKENLAANGWNENYEQQTISAPVGTTVTATAKSYDGFTCEQSEVSGVVRGGTADPLILDLYYKRNVTTITLDANGGQFSNGQQTVTLTGLYDNTVTGAPENPTRTGYIFKDWEQDTVVYTLSKYPANDLNLSAAWTPKTITISFFLDVLDDETTLYATLTGKYGDPIGDVPTVTVNENQLFSGWTNSSGNAFAYTTFPADDEDFYGSVDINGHYLTLFVGGEQQGDPIPVLNGTSVTAESIGYEPPSGYRLTGWRVANSQDAALAVFPMTLTADTTLYGFIAPATYSITTYIYADGELEEGPSEENLPYGQPFDLPEPYDYTYLGYGFRGWFTDPDLQVPYVKPANMPAEDIVLYGEYYIMTGTIEFDPNGGEGTVPPSITKELGQTVKTLPDGSGLSKEYFVFDGWSSSLSGVPRVTQYTFTDEGTVTLYAIWKVNYANVSFNLNGAEQGTQPASRWIELGKSVAAADLPSGEDFVKTGFIFTGWSDQPNATTALDAYAPTATGNPTLYAVWVADKVTLVAKEGSTTVIDNDRGFIYGLACNLTAEDLKNDYLTVIGNGHLEIDGLTAGTKTTVNVINDYSGNIDATYKIVIFGDLDGDGTIGPNDVTLMRSAAAQVNVPDEDSATWFAADITHDGMIAPNDYTDVRAAAVQMKTISQTID